MPSDMMIALTAWKRCCGGVRDGEIDEESRKMDDSMWAEQLWPIRYKQWGS